MLVLSESASTAIRNMVDLPGRPDVTGVRIAGQEGGPGQLSVSTVGVPEDGDQVIEEQGARLFLEPTAAEILDDKVLEASVDEQGRISFLVGTQQ
jgi:iron-sulfur cluster assembly protein